MWRVVVMVLVGITLAKSDIVYTRWGRKDCPRGSDIVYRGYVAGSAWIQQGGSAKVICLPEEPIYGDTESGVQGHSSIYSAEYESSQNIPHVGTLKDHDMPCAVCVNKEHSTSFMVPARNQCFNGWRLQYSGYLWGGPMDQGYVSPKDYICVDKNAQAAGGQSSGDEPKVSMYVVESSCGKSGPLPCPPYQNGWELTCALCAN